MAIQPRRALPSLPDDRTGLAAAPAHGALPASVFDYQNHLARVRTREVHKNFSYSADAKTTSMIGVNQDLQVVWPSSPGVSHVFISVHYQLCVYSLTASELVTLGTPIVARIDATLYNHDTAVLIDAPGCRWDYADGTLPQTTVVNGFVPRIGVVTLFSRNRIRYGAKHVSTSHRVSDAEPSISRPRCLLVPSASAGANLRVRLQTTNVRILSADVWERYEPEI